MVALKTIGLRPNPKPRRRRKTKKARRPLMRVKGFKRNPAGAGGNYVAKKYVVEIVAEGKNSALIFSFIGKSGVRVTNKSNAKTFSDYDSATDAGKKWVKHHYFKGLRGARVLTA